MGKAYTGGWIGLEIEERSFFGGELRDKRVAMGGAPLNASSRVMTWNLSSYNARAAVEGLVAGLSKVTCCTYVSIDANLYWVEDVNRTADTFRAAWIRAEPAPIGDDGKRGKKAKVEFRGAYGEITVSEFWEAFGVAMGRLKEAEAERRRQVEEREAAIEAEIAARASE